MIDARGGDRISAGDILRGTADLLRRGAVRAGVAVAVMTSAGAAINSGMIAIDYADAADFLLTIFILVMQYWLTKAMLRDLRGEALAASRFAAFVVLGVVTTTGILLGLVLMVVPGIVLMVRWSIAVPILLGSDDTIFAALGRSWRDPRASSGRSWWLSSRSTDRRSCSRWRARESSSCCPTVRGHPAARARRQRRVDRRLACRGRDLRRQGRRGDADRGVRMSDR